MDNKIKFAIEDIEKFRDDDDPELAIAKVKFLSTKPNSHKINITEEILERDAKTILGKFLVAKMDFLGKDATTHRTDQSIMGYFPKEQSIEFEKEGEYLIASAKAVISKLYATDYYNMFIDDNKRDVSVEMTTYGMEEYPDGSSDIEGLNLTGCTTLGHGVKPSSPNAHMEIIQFSEQRADEFYHNKMSIVSELQKFADERRLKMAEEKYESHPVDTSKDAVDMGDWNGDKAKKDLLKEKNFETVGKKVCLDFKSGERILANCKYPVMNLKDGKWVYNKEGISSALAYGEQHDETVASKAKALQKKLGLDKDSEEKGGDAKMSQEKFATDIGNLWSTVYCSLETKYPDKDYGSIYRIYGIYEESNKKFAVISKKDEQQLYRLDFDLSETDGLVLSDEIIMVEQEFVEGEKIRKFEAPEDSDKYTKFENSKEQKKEDKKDDSEKDTSKKEEDKNKETEEKMSLDANVDVSAYLEMLENETEKYRDLGKELLSKMGDDKNVIMRAYLDMAKERDELLAYKEKREKEDVEFEVNKTLMEVKEDLTNEEFEDLKKEGLGCKFENLSAFSNKVQAFAYKNAKTNGNNNKEENHMRMSFSFDDYLNKDLAPKTADDIFNQYLK